MLTSLWLTGFQLGQPIHFWSYPSPPPGLNPMVGQFFGFYLPLQAVTAKLDPRIDQRSEQNRRMIEIDTKVITLPRVSRVTAGVPVLSVPVSTTPPSLRELLAFNSKSLPPPAPIHTTGSFILVIRKPSVTRQAASNRQNIFKRRTHTATSVQHQKLKEASSHSGTRNSARRATTGLRISNHIEATNHQVPQDTAPTRKQTPPRKECSIRIM